MSGKVLQFELWRDCSQNCFFCYNRYIEKETDSIKIKNIKLLMNILDNNETFEKYSTISLIGGEFFNGQLNSPEVKTAFFKLGQKIFSCINDKKINNFWVTASLIQNDISELILYLNIFKDVIDCICICTSYDTVGRFHTEQQKTVWKKNMFQLRHIFPKMQITINTVITGEFIDEYLSDKFKLADYYKKYCTSMFFKPPMILKYPKYAIPGNKTELDCDIDSSVTIQLKKQFNEMTNTRFFPTRSAMLKFLLKFIKQESLKEYDNLYSYSKRADDLIEQDYHILNTYHLCKRGKTSIIEEAKKLNASISNLFDQDLKTKDIKLLKKYTCGHMNICQPYVDSSACFICDKIEIKKIMV